MVVTVGGALKSDAHICPPQLDTEARGEAVTLADQRTGTLPQPADLCHAPELQTSSKAPSDPNRRQRPSKQYSTRGRGRAGNGSQEVEEGKHVVEF